MDDPVTGYVLGGTVVAAFLLYVASRFRAGVNWGGLAAGYLTVGVLLAAYCGIGFFAGAQVLWGTLSCTGAAVLAGVVLALHSRLP